MKFNTLFILSLFLPFLVFAQEEEKNPAFEEVISLRSVGGVSISPDGSQVAFTMSPTL